MRVPETIPAGVSRAIVLEVFGVIGVNFVGTIVVDVSGQLSYEHLEQSSEGHHSRRLV